LEDLDQLRETYTFSEKLFAKLQSFQSTLEGGPSTVREEYFSYDEGTPF
jgi:hypothetical protein